MKLLFYLSFILFLFSCNFIEERENEQDLQKISKGMTYREVNEVMRNKPFKSEKSESKDAIFYDSYYSPFGYSDHFHLEFSSKDSTVVDIWYGD